MNKGFTLWLTGLPGAGKATISHLLEKKLKENHGINPEVLTSELIRTNLSPEIEYNKLDQDVIIHCAIFLCKVLTRNRIAVISTVTSPQRTSRERARAEIDNFVEIYVKCPLALCAIRDAEGIHHKALKGEILEFMGKSDPYEEPLNPDIAVETDKETAEDAADKIVKRLLELNYVAACCKQQA